MKWDFYEWLFETRSLFFQVVVKYQVFRKHVSKVNGKKNFHHVKNSLYYCRQFSKFPALFFLLCKSVHFLSYIFYAISRKKIGNVNYFFQNFDNYPEKFYFYFSSHFCHPEHLFWIAPESSDFCLVALLVKILTFRTWKQQMLKDIWYLPQTGTVPADAWRHSQAFCQ